jgi:phosphatidylglycerol:prolipoprotein diacylglycerol transferase
MCNDIIHIYGPIFIHSFGLFIVGGIILFSWFFLRHSSRKKIVTVDDFFTILTVSIIIAILGARLLYVMTDWNNIENVWEVFAFWDGGFSLLGAVISIILIVPFFLAKNHISILPFFDLVALHAALLQSIARIGCFFAGCCYGAITSVPWAIYSADTCILLHPAQLYSAGLLFVIFLCMYFIIQPLCKIPGQMLCIYLILIGTERYIIDFFRGDKEYFTFLSTSFSIHQYIAMAMCTSAVIGLVLIHILYYHKKIT